MDKRERSAKKRKVAEKDSQKSEVVIATSKSHTGRTKQVEQSRKQQEPANRSKPLLDKSKEQRKVVNKVSTKEDEASDGPEIAPSEVFLNLNITPEIQKAISTMGFSEMRPIQQHSIPSLLTGKDVIATSKPGSGKSLSALISSISLLASKRFKPRNGTGVIILTPTRELAHQLLGVASELLAGAIQTTGTATGGSNFRSEAEKLEKGVNVLIATPHRLLEHLKKTTAFIVKDLKTLVLDDVERLLDTETKEVILQIIELLPKEKQTVLLTTIDPGSELIESLHLKAPVKVQVEETSEEQLAPAEGCIQGYVVIEPEKRFLLLYSFVKKFQKKKVVVVLSSTAAAKSYADILNAMGLPVLEIHGKQTTQKRSANLCEFKNTQQGILICADAVLQGLEIPKVDWNIQYDPPENPRRYISRLGRTATRSVVFLQPSESGFVDYLKGVNIATEEFEFSKKQLFSVQGNIEKLVSKNYALNCEMKDAFRSYLKNYKAHILSSIFDVSKLDLVKVAKSFGFDIPPRVEVEESEEKEEKWKMTYGPTKLGVKGIKRKRVMG